MSQKNPVILIVLGAFILLGLFSVSVNLFWNQAGSKHRDILKAKEFDAKLEMDVVKDYESLERRIREPVNEMMTSGRNIFSEVKEIKQDAVFVLEAIEPDEIPIVFKGSIVRGDSVVIGQINWGNRTYFVKPNEEIQGYKIVGITREKVEIQDQKGALMVLNLNETSYSDEFSAKIRVTKSNQNYIVKQGDAISGYQVSSVSARTVILASQETKEEIVLKL